MAKFFKCMHCGMVAVKLSDYGCNPSCCGETMKELKAGTTEAAVEKHIPVVSVSGSTVSAVVGSVLHPMAEDHYIEWIYFETNMGGAFRYLKPGMEPKAVYALSEGEKLVGVYAYCNKHGLWAANL